MIKQKRFQTLMRAGAICLLAIGNSACYRSTVDKDAISELRTVTLLRDAETRYRALHGRYAKWTELVQSAMGIAPLTSDSGQANGHMFQILVTHEGYTLTARPLVPGKTGYRSLYCDQTGIIRESYGSDLATVGSRQTGLSPGIELPHPGIP
jgi:hypothetical protein